MYSNKPIIYKNERRKKPDILCRWLEIAGALAWIVLFLVLLFYQNAQPQTETFFDRFFNIELRETPDIQLLRIVLYLLIFLLVFSSISLYLNSKRLKRSTDRIHKSFIFSLIGSFVGIILFLISYVF